MLKKLKREQSVRVLEGEDSPTFPGHPSPADFLAFYPWACARARLQSQRADPSGAPLPPPPQLHRVQQEEYVSAKTTDKAKSAKGKKTTARASGSREARPAAEDTSSDGGGDGPAAAAPLALTAAYDARGRLVEVSLVTRPAAACAVPRYALRALAPCAPHQPQLIRISVRGRLEPHALRDIRSLLSLSALTEVRVEDSPLPHGDCRALLSEPAPSRLRYLALRRCRLDDASCLALASRPPSLAILDLSSNAISDAGAASLAASLRADRSLRYLNLSDNRIGDPGCLALLAALAEFALTGDEIARERQRRLARAREALTALAVARAASRPSMVAASSARSDARPAKGKVGARATSMAAVASPRKGKGGRAAASAAEAAAEGEAPEEGAAYGRGETRCRDGYVYCAGNAELRCLNLAYNRLEVVSVRRLAEVVRAGAERGGGGGLVRVVVEGNPLPREASEAAELQRALEGGLLPAAHAPAHTARDKTARGGTPK